MGGTPALIKTQASPPTKTTMSDPITFEPDTKKATSKTKTKTESSKLSIKKGKGTGMNTGY